MSRRPSRRVPELMKNLFTFVVRSETPMWYPCRSLPLRARIHPPLQRRQWPRLVRLWHHSLLQHDHPVFESVPLESTIKSPASGILPSARSLRTKPSKSTPFIEFSLAVLVESLEEFMRDLRPEPVSAAMRLERARAHFGKKVFRRKDYLDFFKTLSTATASRDHRRSRKRVAQRTGQARVDHVSVRKKWQCFEKRNAAHPRDCSSGEKVTAPVTATSEQPNLPPTVDRECGDAASRYPQRFEQGGILRNRGVWTRTVGTPHMEAVARGRPQELDVTPL